MVLVFLSMYGVMFLITQYFQLVLGFSPLSAAMRFLPIAPIMMLLSPQTPRISGRFGANRTVSMGMGLVALAFLGFTALDRHTSYVYVLVCVVFLVTGIALTTSPMTASIMSAVPARRAGAGSAMNDATRELGSALGVAILGSIAASRYSSGLKSSLGALSSADRTVAKGSLAGAIQAAPHLTGEAATRFVSAADNAFMSGIHFAALTGAVLAGTASMIVLRFLPREVNHEGAMHDGLSSLENTLELTIAGGMPVFNDLPLRDEAAVPPTT
jgi:hypothetical protein